MTEIHSIINKVSHPELILDVARLNKYLSYEALMYKTVYWLKNQLLFRYNQLKEEINYYHIHKLPLDCYRKERLTMDYLNKLYAELTEFDNIA